MAIVMGPDVAPLFRQGGIGGWSYGRPELFSLPVELDTRTEGWTNRVREAPGGRPRPGFLTRPGRRPFNARLINDPMFRVNEVLREAVL